MMLKHILAAGSVVVSLVGPAQAATVTHFLDVFVTSNFNTSTGMQETQYVDPVSQAGILTISYDTADAFDNGFGSSSVFLDGFAAFFNSFPSTFDLTLVLGGLSQTWSQSEFLIAEATVDGATATELESVDFILLTTGSSRSLANPNISDITPEPGFDFLRFDAAGNITGIELEIQTVAPIPLPASLPLLAAGVLLLGAFRKRVAQS